LATPPSALIWVFAKSARAETNGVNI